MGVERAVTRWYLQRQMILNEIALLEAQVAQMQPAEKPVIQAIGSVVADESAMAGDVRRQLAMAQAKLTALGHCPKPMMG
ncbi:hypothetical protein [Dictyobacter arantiisoli]|uniref:Uncharacterized protein n=1 Tax=Dictyobacter arantiisoli TaxID=2014874 RepID=A0A5A5TCN4_9CHLR|nr:hypothetical protein [Dictyobacter arantiisoli]GCF09212.1 hypothetical protein KDI_27760 [Dictyobacter arantiisoli]